MSEDFDDMGQICPTCGLEKSLCICTELAKQESNTINVFVERRKWGREMTVIDGIDTSIDIRKMVKKLKGKLACGGTAKDDKIELQGNHMPRITELLEAEGFPSDRIDIAWATGRSRGRRRR